MNRVPLVRKPRSAYLGLGSNLGNSLDAMREAVKRLSASENISVRAVSSLYRTKPWGKTDQPDFLNAVVALKTTLSPEALLDVAHDVERALGRVRKEHWGPRVIDVDILWMQSIERSGADLVLPHPYITERAFVLAPLAELAPMISLRGRSVASWRECIDDTDVRRISGPEWAEARG